MATHKCPKDGCNTQCPPSMLACRAHWYSVSTATRSRVNREWRKGISEEYLEAREQAVREMNDA